MAEFQEVVKQFKRMCKSVTPMKCTRGECPMGCENIGQCRKVAFGRPASFEEQVMAWAAEHPEPVYPTWLEWLEKMGIMADIHDRLNSYKQVMEVCEEPLYSIPTAKVFCPIPADIAQKLGIEPKEG